MKTTVNNFHPTSYEGQYEAAEGDLKVTGTVSTNSEKKITNLQGEVGQDGKRIGSFYAYWDGERYRYNTSDSDVENVVTVIQAASKALAAVEAAIE